jgi:hypothetical protein
MEEDVLSVECDRFRREARNKIRPFHEGMIAQGVDWARVSCRLPGRIELRLRTLGAAESVKLLLDASVACETMNDVPSWLTEQYKEELS